MPEGGLNYMSCIYIKVLKPHFLSYIPRQTRSCEMRSNFQVVGEGVKADLREFSSIIERIEHKLLDINRTPKYTSLSIDYDHLVCIE